MSMIFLQTEIIDTKAIDKAVKSNKFLQHLKDLTWQDIVNGMPEFVTGLLVLLVFYLIANYTEKLFIGLWRRNSKSKNALESSFFGKVLWVLVFGIGLTLTLSIWGLKNLSSGILGIAGIGTFIVTFALRDIFENFLAGSILAFNPPFEIGNIIQINNMKGTVKDMRLRETLITSADGSQVYIPNSMLLKNPLQNFTLYGTLKKTFSLNFRQDIDPEVVINIINETLTSVPGVMQGESKAPIISITDVNNSLIVISCAYWIELADKRFDANEVNNEVMSKTIKALLKGGDFFPTGVTSIQIAKDQS